MLRKRAVCDSILFLCAGEVSVGRLKRDSRLWCLSDCCTEMTFTLCGIPGELLGIVSTNPADAAAILSSIGVSF